MEKNSLLKIMKAICMFFSDAVFWFFSFCFLFLVFMLVLVVLLLALAITIKLLLKFHSFVRREKRLRRGYEYSYGFYSVGGDDDDDDETIGSPSEVIFQFRTFFTLRDARGYQMTLGVDEEGMSVILPVTCDDPFACFDHVRNRLDRYLLTEHETQTLVGQALDFARRGEHPVIAIDINVCTVQLDGETVDEANDRSVRPACLDLARPDAAAAGMEDESCLLPCRQDFHTNCIVRWLLEFESCPMCQMKEEEEQLDCPITQAQPEKDEILSLVVEGSEVRG